MHKLFLPMDRPLVVAHRGLRSDDWEENTPAAFAAAHDAGADWVELDARRSADGVPVLYHNGWTPDGVAVMARTAVELAELGLVSLEEVLDGLPDGMGVDLEVKNLPGEPDYDPEDDIVRLVAEVVRAAADRPMMVSSFNPLTVAALVRELPDIPACLVHFDSLSVGAAAGIAAEQGAVAVCSRVRSPGLDTDGIAAAHAAGMAVLVWTVNDVPTAARLVTAGVDGMVTDNPGLLLAAMAPDGPRPPP